jgi:hypothetical protein
MFQHKLEKLLNDAKNNADLRKQLIKTKNSSEPMKEFCNICQSFGHEIYLGELFAYGQDMNDSKLRATNGGGSFAIEGWDDALENIYDELEKAER